MIFSLHSHHRVLTQSVQKKSFLYSVIEELPYYTVYTIFFCTDCVKTLSFTQTYVDKY